jgi:glycosyltransferase involved in cell wall biosynthesis
VGPDKLRALYCAAEAYVVMSNAETQSLSLMQGFAFGVPAVAAKSRGLIDYVPQDCGFLVEPGNADALAEKLELLLSDQALRSQMGTAGTKFVRTFAPDKIAARWEDVYRGVIRQAKER